MGESNLLDAVVVSVEGEGAVVRTAGGRRIGAADSPARVGDRVARAAPSRGGRCRREAGADDGGLVGIVEDVAEPGPVERAAFSSTGASGSR